jgi:peptidoglycan-associated lipoprotein
MKQIVIITTLVAASLALSACGKKPSPADISSMTPGSESAGQASGDYDAQGNYIGPGNQADLQRSAGSDRVFFDFDSFALDNEDQETLRRQASWLAQYPNVTVTIEGHADERSTRDYNIALGARRANAAKNFLAALGVSTARMTTISYGKERPDALGSDEQSWARNRRAVTVVIRPM